MTGKEEKTDRKAYSLNDELCTVMNEFRERWNKLMHKEWGKLFGIVSLKVGSKQGEGWFVYITIDPDFVKKVPINSHEIVYREIAQYWNELADEAAKGKAFGGDYRYH